MGIIQTILFLVFVLPVLMIKDAWARVTKNMTDKEKKDILWKIPYLLIAILVLVAITLYLNGYK